MSGLQTFIFGGKSPVRIIVIGGEPWFVASDVARTLGYTNPTKAIRDHCKGTNETFVPSVKGDQLTKIIREGDVFRLVMKSKLPEAQAFESWVMDEVLPALRRTGSYSMPGAEPPKDRRPRLTAAFLTKMEKQIGFKNTQDWLISHYPEMFGNLKHPLPQGPFEVSAPHLPLETKPTVFRLVPEP